ncbi:hypothetical protein PENSTE_c007G05058 [Penicillium steckii]|uniref:FAD-binding domain-containing protein n=1 Tax=Penicillium steckii TaxID=303698 RepID=A0A1V6TDA0_9EURO|nr:hypothetical protein PENSTE_c007G05058 [Penicillium steckii]
MLEIAGISYCLWEAYSEFAPSVGASLGLTPAGLRILDQIGVFEDVNKMTVPHQKWEHRDSDGNLHAKFTALRSSPELLGYEAFFTERQMVLQALYDSIEDKSRLVPNKRVVAVRQTDEGATLVAHDGSRITCEIVAGAEGVRSVIRKEILKRERIPEDPKLRFDAKYACVYGISNPVSNIEPGCNFFVYRPEASIIVFSGKGGVLYWFILNDLKQHPIRYETPQIFSEKDINALYLTIADTTVTEGVRFADIYKQKRTAVMTALEEGVADSLFSGRLFVLGDSAHKMTPNGAMGANQAFESAAAFVNVLRPLLRRNFEDNLIGGISMAEVASCLQQYSDRRRERVLGILNDASIGCQAQLKIGPISDKIWRELSIMTDKEMLKKSLKSVGDAEMLTDWPYGSHRVAIFTATAEELRKASNGSQAVEQGALKAAL